MESYASSWIDSEMSLFADQVARIIANEFLPDAETWEADRQIGHQTWSKLAATGLLCVGVSERYGGGGGNLAHEAVVLQELARAGLGGGLGIAVNIHSAIVAHYISNYGTDEQRVRWLPAMVRADAIGALAMTEPGTGSDLRNIRTSLTPTVGGWKLNGQKTFISNGQTANLILVAARTCDAADGLSLAVVETETTEGFHRGRNLEKLGLHAQDTSELFFDEVFIPSANVLGARAGQGMHQLMQQLAWERMMIAQTSLVNMERAVELTTHYVKERTAFGKPLFDFQNTQFVLAESKTQATVGRRFFDTLMVQLLENSLSDVEASMAKLWLTDTAFKVIDACQQLFGGYGYMTEYPIARLFADSRVSRIYGGANEIMKVIISRSMK